jgi:FAD/FMN-containing dehydrogenase
MERREFLRNSGIFAAHLIGSSLIITPAFMKQAQAVTGLPLNDLRSRLNDQSLMLVPSDAQFAKYQTSFNRRIELVPQLRVLCETAETVATTIRWARQNNIPFSIRSGGHSYEGFSQSSSVVIDVRSLNSIQISADKKTATVGAGCTLGSVYEALAEQGLMIPAGTCGNVGIAGHVLGGGFGMSSRQFGLACDNVISFQLVNADSQLVNASADTNADLFWALRGGGGGSFGVLTKIVFRMNQLAEVSSAAVSWKLPLEEALQVVKAWQNWAPKAPDSITTYLHLFKAEDDLVGVYCGGQSTNSEDHLKGELLNWLGPSRTESFDTSTRSFIEATRQFGKGDPVFMKGKSDYLFQPMSDAGIRTLLKGLLDLPTGFDILFDGYGGAVAQIPNDATAFSHRQALYSIQYYCEWDNSQDSVGNTAKLTALYMSMRPYVSGAAYVNYCDVDLKNWAEAYWGENLPRLVSIKNAVDPKNIFNHAQSVPLKMTR